jgi:hypothetical protein
VPLACPTSKQPYVYDYKGFQDAMDAAAPGEGARAAPGQGRLIVYDAQPCHAGHRWGIVVDPPQPGQPLVLRVVLK